MRDTLTSGTSLLVLGAALAIGGCGEAPPAPTIEPEPTAEEEARRPPNDEARTAEEVAEAVREELRAAGFAPAVPLGFASEEEDGSTYDRIAAILAAAPRVTRVRIGVHSNPRGSAAYNRRLTLERARAAAAALIARGIACERLEPTGFGEDRPLPDAPMEAQSRVVLSVLRVDDVDVGAPDDVEGPDACP